LYLQDFISVMSSERPDTRITALRITTIAFQLKEALLEKGPRFTFLVQLAL
jgi:hypothetical protein